LLFDTRLSPREVTRKYTVENMVKHAESETMIQMEVIIYATNLSYKQIPTPEYKSERRINKANLQKCRKLTATATATAEFQTRDKVHSIVRDL
jgi:hypothetical protein